MDIRERGHFAAVAIPAQSYGEIDRRKSSSRRRERNYVFVDACLSRDEIREGGDRAGNSSGGKGTEELLVGKIPNNYNTAGMLAQPRDASSPFVRVLPLVTAMTIRNSIVRPQSEVKLLASLFSFAISQDTTHT